MYTLNAVWQQNSSSNNPHILPALTYFNNVLENCSISFVGIEMEALDRTANQIAYAEWGEVVRTFATCSIPSVEGRTWFNITQEYNYVPPTISYSSLWGSDQFLGGSFLESNKENKTSLWWGESLMSTYWVSTIALTRSKQSANVELSRALFLERCKPSHITTLPMGPRAFARARSLSQYKITRNTS